MTLSISITAEAEARLREKAAHAGLDVETYAARALERLATSRPSLDELSGPVAREVAAGGMSEDELSELLEAEKHAMRAERRHGAPGGGGRRRT